MNIHNVKKAQKRFDVRYLSTMNIQTYGKDNLYPQRMLELLKNSPTARTCCNRYETFIEGGGFSDKMLAEFVCNRSRETVAELLHLVAKDLAEFSGFALHVIYDMMGQIVEVQHIPFEACRLEEEDDLGHVTYINYHPDWTGKKTRSGNRIPVTSENVKKFYVFNPNPFVVLDQVEESGGMDKYLGQILWYSMDGRYKYPTPIYDSVVTCMSTDDGLDNVKYRNVRNNFLLAGMFIHKKAMQLGIDPDTGKPVDSNDVNSAISESLDIFQGDENACAIMDVTINQEEDFPEFKSFEAQNFDKKFETTEKSTEERIYAAFNQEVFYCIRTGKLGFSGTVVNDAFEYYNSCVMRERTEISKVFRKVFSCFAVSLNDDNPICPTDDFSILPVKHISNEESNENSNKQ